LRTKIKFYVYSDIWRIRTGEVMRKLFALGCLLITTPALQALPVNNPIEASLYTDGIIWCEQECRPCRSWCDALSLRAGFWGDYVFNRNLETKSSSTINNVTAVFAEGDAIQKFSIYKNQGVLTLNYCNWLDIFGVVGVANFEQYANPLYFNQYRGTALIFYDPAVSYGGGARMTVWECGCFGFGIEGQYFGAAPKLSSFTYQLDAQVNYPQNVKASSYNEWQVGFGTSYRLEGYGNALVPYVAVKFAGVKFTQYNSVYFCGDGNDSLSQGDLKNSRTVGFAVGMTATSIDKGGITVEGRFADETAVFVNGEIRF
jgi:major outer membrane protein